MSGQDPSGTNGDSDLAAALAALRKQAEALVKTSDTFKWLTADVPVSLEGRASMQEEFIHRMRDGTVSQVSLGTDQTRLGEVLDRSHTEAQLQRALAGCLRQLGGGA